MNYSNHHVVVPVELWLNINHPDLPKINRINQLGSSIKTKQPNYEYEYESRVCIHCLQDTKFARRCVNLPPKTSQYDYGSHILTHFKLKTKTAARQRRTSISSTSTQTRNRSHNCDIAASCPNLGPARVVSVPE